MDLKKKRNVAITAGLTAVLALSPVVVPAATAFANEGAPETTSAQSGQIDVTFVADGKGTTIAMVADADGHVDAEHLRAELPDFDQIESFSWTDANGSGHEFGTDLLANYTFTESCTVTVNYKAANWVTIPVKDEQGTPVGELQVVEGSKFTDGWAGNVAVPEGCEIDYFDVQGQPIREGAIVQDWWGDAGLTVHFKQVAQEPEVNWVTIPVKDEQGTPVGELQVVEGSKFTDGWAGNVAVPEGCEIDYFDVQGQPIREGAIVQDWWGDTGLTVHFKQVAPVAKSTTVYFQVGDDTYTITLTGTVPFCFDDFVDTFLKTYASKLDVEGYEFKGWMDENGNKVDQWLVLPAGSSMTIKADFEKAPEPVATHTVTFYDGDERMGAVTRGGDQLLSTYLNDLSNFNDLSREGYALTWVTKSGDEVKPSDTISGDLTLYARWDAIHTVNFFDKDGKGLGTIALAGDQELSAYVERLEQGVDIPFVDGYTFVGWATKSGDAVLSNDTISGDLNLYAQYTKNPATYTVNFFDENGRGLCTVALSGNHTLQEYIDRLYESVDVPFKDGCYIEWTTKSGDVVLSTDTIQGTLNLYLNFRQSPATHTVNFFDADGNGLATIAKSGDLAFSAYTDTLAESGIEAPYKEGYTFTGWTTKSGDAILSSDVISGDINVYATYQKNAAIHTVNFFDEDGNGLCTTTNAGDVAFSEYVAKLLEVTEIPTKDGYVFAGWVTKSGDKILNTDVISGDINVYASYEKVVDPVAETHKVTFDDCLESTENTVAVVEDGQTVAKPADPTCEGYTFLGWYTDTALTQEYDFTAPVTSDMTLWAKWEKNADATVTPGENAETPTDPATEQAAEDAVPNTGDATVAVSGIAGLGAALAGLGAFLKRRRS